MVLVTHFESGVCNYIDLGKEFQLDQKERSPDEFKKTADIFFGNNLDSFIENCYGFITYDRGSKVTPLYKGQANFVLTNSGEELLDLSFKK